MNNSPGVKLYVMNIGEINNERIEVGDIVEVCLFERMWWRGLEVLSMPQVIGDCWILRELEKNQITYIQQFKKMNLIQKRVK